MVGGNRQQVVCNWILNCIYLNLTNFNSSWAAADNDHMTHRCRYLIFQKGNFSGWRPMTCARKIKPTSARQTGLPSRSLRWEDMALGILSLTLFCFLRRFHCSPPMLLQWTSKKADPWQLPNICGPQPAPASVAAWDAGPRRYLSLTQLLARGGRACPYLPLFHLNKGETNRKEVLLPR